MANPPSQEMISSLQHWWALAGVDLDYGNQPTALLVSDPEIPRPIAAPALAVTEHLPEETKAPPLHRPLPAAYEDFIAWLANDKDLIEARWSKKRVAPQGVLEPEIMIISGLPEKDQSGDDELFDQDNRKLLDRMLSAIGCDSEQSYITTIAVSASIDGRIDEQHWPSLKERIHHHIGFVRPKRVICFGDLAAKIIFGQDMLTARKNKQFINQESSKTEAIVTFHPRILIERPSFKAEAWKDLQMLTRISAP